MRFLRSAIFAALPAFLWLTPANATPVEFDYHGAACVYCGSEPAGTTLEIKIWLDSSIVVPDAVLFLYDNQYSMTADFGSIHLDNSGGGNHGSHLYGTLDDTASAFQTYTWNFAAGDAFYSDVGTVIQANDTSYFLYFGSCTDFGCGVLYEGDYKGYAFGDTQPLAPLTRVDATTGAPEPLTLSLFAAGLFGLGFRRRQSV